MIINTIITGNSGGLPPVSPMSNFTIEEQYGVKVIKHLDFSNNPSEVINIPEKDEEGNDLYINVELFSDNPNFGAATKVIINTNNYYSYYTGYNNYVTASFNSPIEEIVFTKGVFPTSAKKQNTTIKLGFLFNNSVKKITIPDNAIISTNNFQFSDSNLINNNFNVLLKYITVIDSTNFSYPTTFRSTVGIENVALHFPKLSTISGFSNSTSFNPFYNVSKINFVFENTIKVSANGKYCFGNWTNSFLYVPDNLVEEYKADDAYSNIVNYIKPISELEE